MVLKIHRWFCGQCLLSSFLFISLLLVFGSSLYPRITENNNGENILAAGLRISVVLLQMTASPWTTETSTRERWQFGALTNRKATSSNRAPSLSSLYYYMDALSLYRDKGITIIRLWWLSQWLVTHGHHLAVTIYLHVARHLLAATVYRYGNFAILIRSETFSWTPYLKSKNYGFLHPIRIQIHSVAH